MKCLHKHCGHTAEVGLKTCLRHLPPNGECNISSCLKRSVSRYIDFCEMHNNILQVSFKNPILRLLVYPKLLNQFYNNITKYNVGIS